MRNQQVIKLFIVLFICTTFMYSLSHFGVLAYNAMTSDSTQYDKGTAVGSVNLTGKTKSEALTFLIEQQQKWRSETTIQLQYKEKTIPIDLDIFQFEIENSIDAVRNGQENPLLVNVNPIDIKNILKQVSHNLTLTDDEFNKLNTEFLRNAVDLSIDNHTILLEKTIGTTSKNPERINQVQIKLNDVTVEMGDWVNELSPIMIEPQAKVSLVKLFKDKGFTTMPDSIKSMIATGIYEAVLPTNFKIIERNTTQYLPEYAKLGYEANINVNNNRDFVFSNPNSSSYQLEMQWIDNTLMIVLSGSKFLNEYKVNLGETQQFKPKTIVQYSPLLKSVIKVQQEGQEGRMIKVYRDVFDESGVWLEKQFLAEDYYPPIHRVEIHPLQSLSPTAENGTITNASEQSISMETSGTRDSSNPETQTDEGLYGKPNEAKK